VWSWQGGVGKTVIAGNLAAGLAEELGRPICLAEATEGPSRLAPLMGAASSLTLRDLAELEQPLTMSALRRVVAPTPYQVGLLTAAPTVDGVNDLGSSEWMSRAGSKLRECPITTILDLPSAWSDLTRRALAECTSLVLVTPPDAASLEITADAWISIRQQIPTNPTVYVAMNAIQDDRRWSDEAIKQRLHAEAVVAFPHDSKTQAETWKRGCPLLKRDRGSRWRHSRDQLAKIISAELLDV
jgi:MinD-like ATPase involved in chromosome partitioning or flagellar assembly